MLVFTEIDATLDQIARLAASQGALVRFVEPEQIIEMFRVVCETAGLDELLKDHGIHFSVGRIDVETIAHAAQKRIVNQITGVEIGGENQKLLERHFDFLARMQCEIVDAPLKRDDPTVQEIMRINPLSAKIVNDERAAIRFHLKRRFIKAYRRAVYQIHC